MFPRHARHLDLRVRILDIDEAFVEVVEVVDLGERVFDGGGGRRREVGFGVGGCDDGEV